MKPATSMNSPGVSETKNAEPDEQLLRDVVFQTAPRPVRAEGIALGIFEGYAGDGVVLVSIEAFGLTRIPARSITSLDPEHIGQTLALGFEGGDPMRPIVLGPMLAQAVAPAVQTTALIDGERLVLSAEREIELRCGDAALILSADGRIQLRGTYITSHASATQRILGGSVNIN